MINKEVAEIFNVTHNIFWRKWRDAPLTSQGIEWETIMKEYHEIMEQHDCELCRHIMVDLLMELLGRCKERERAKDGRKTV